MGNFIRAVAGVAAVGSSFVMSGGAENVFADGAGSPAECLTGPNVLGSQTGSGDVVTVDLTPYGKIADYVCIKAGQLHTGPLEENGEYFDCYTVSGIGEQSVTVELTGTPGPDCQEISHIDVGKEEIPTTTTTTVPETTTTTTVPETTTTTTVPETTTTTTTPETTTSTTTTTVPETTTTTTVPETTTTTVPETTTTTTPEDTTTTTVAETTTTTEPQVTTTTEAPTTTVGSSTSEVTTTTVAGNTTTTVLTPTTGSLPATGVGERERNIAEIATLLVSAGSVLVAGTSLFAHRRLAAVRTKN